jgi:Tfp pilus assembly protein PilO
MEKSQNLENSVTCSKTKWYQPTIYRVLALAFSIIFAITINTINYFSQSFQKQHVNAELKKLTFEDKLKEDTYNLVSHVEARIFAIKELRLYQHSPIHTLSQINKRLSFYDHIKLDSITHNNNLITISGNTSNIEQLAAFTKDFEFSQGLFTGVSFSFNSISENEIYFQIKSTYNPPIASAVNNNGSEIQENQTSQPNEIKATVKKSIVPEALRIKLWQKRYEEAQLNLRTLQDFLPENIESSLVFELLTKESKKNQLQLQKFSLNDLVNREHCKEQLATVSIRGNYNNVGKFLESLACSRRILEVNNLEIKKLPNPSKDQTVEATFTLSMFFATKKDVTPLFSISKTEFYKSFDNSVELLEQNNFQESEQNLENSPEEQTQLQEDDPYYNGYTTIKNNPFR